MPNVTVNHGFGKTEDPPYMTGDGLSYAIDMLEKTHRHHATLLQQMRQYKDCPQDVKDREERMANSCMKAIEILKTL